MLAETEGLSVVNLVLLAAVVLSLITIMWGCTYCFKQMNLFHPTSSHINGLTQNSLGNINHFLQVPPLVPRTRNRPRGPSRVNSKTERFIGREEHKEIATISEVCDKQAVSSPEDMDDLLSRIKGITGGEESRASSPFSTPPSTPHSLYMSPRTSTSNLYQPSVQNITEGELLQVPRIGVEQKESIAIDTENENDDKQSQIQIPVSRLSSEGTFRCESGLTTGIKPRRNMSTGNLNNIYINNIGSGKNALLDGVTSSPLARRSKSVSDIHTIVKPPAISYTIIFNKLNRTLEFSDINISNLDTPCTSTSTYVQCELIPLNIRKQTAVMPSSSDLFFQDKLIFNEMEECEFSKITVVLTVYNVIEKKRKKGNFAAEIAFPLSTVHVKDGVSLSRRQDLKINKRLKRNSTSNNRLYMDLGNLSVLIQFQFSANRMKVVVLRATHLPPGEKLSTTPEYYVEIALLRKGIQDTVKLTKHQKAATPIWNEPFLFDVPSHQIKSYSIEFILKRSRLLSHDEVVGQVTVGSDSTQAGSAHWREITESYGLECTREHNLLPVLKY